MKKAIILAVVMFAALLVVGFAAMSSSSYMDVSKLQGVNENVEVVVKGQPLNVGIRQMLMEVDGSEFVVSFHGSYGVAELSSGPGLGDEDSYAVFLLEGENGYTVLALYSAKEFINTYGGSASVEGTVVVEGTYTPSTVATIYNPVTGAYSNYKVIMVDKILEGCHSSYEKPAGSLG